ncbi:MAG: cysteine desulfurase [Clostridia bacterium]|nr:cysteine desulfurase [Clostridia bacterium]
MIYLDHAATTFVKKEVFDEMEPYFTKKFGNPSAIYKLGEFNKETIKVAREKVARVINADSSEIYFTSGGSEADNFAITGVALKNMYKGNHIITTKIEHKAVLNTCEYLKNLGFEISYIDVDKDGIVNLNMLKNSIKDSTILISIMFANNEIGTIEPIQEISEIARNNNIYFHTDAVQAVGNIKIDVKKLGVDLLSFSAHKFYGPKGVGALYIKNRTKIDSLIHGGGQENKMRSGTENVPGIVGMGKAIELSYRDFEENTKKVFSLKERLINGLFNNISDIKLNGHRNNRLAGNVNVFINGVNSTTLLYMLNMKDIYVSSGSACNAANDTPSHVLKAIGLTDEEAHSSLRFTIGSENTEEEIDYVVKVLKESVDKLRKL